MPFSLKRTGSMIAVPPNSHESDGPQLTPGQKCALQGLKGWMNSRVQYARLVGAAGSGKTFTTVEFIKSLEFLPTFPFHYDYLRKAVRGDYLNVFVTFDLTLRRLGETVFTTSKGLDPNMKRMSEVINRPDFLIGANSNLSGQAADPFEIPPGTATQHDGPVQ